MRPLNGVSQPAATGAERAGCAQDAAAKRYGAHGGRCCHGLALPRADSRELHVITGVQTRNSQRQQSRPQALLEAVEAAAGSGGQRLRRLDKKGERRGVADHVKALGEALEREQAPPAALSLAVPLLAARVRRLHWLNTHMWPHWDRQDIVAGLAVVSA